MGIGDVVVVSKSIVKPSSATPSRLKIVKLSLLDQLAAHRYLTMVFFYEACADDIREFSGAENRAQICQKLKESLSEALASYYPLAGKADLRKSLVECTDEGAGFVEARVHARLSDVLADSDLEVLKSKYLPLDPLGGMYAGEGPLFAAQVSFFDCGGISLGVCMSHSVADTKCLVEFLNEWAAVFRGHKKPSSPSLHDFDSLSRFLPAVQDFPLWNFSDSSMNNIFSKTYTFTKEKLTSLKRIATSHDHDESQTQLGFRDHHLVDDPTGVELVTAFIWKDYISNNWAANKAFAAAISVDVRSQIKSLQLENAFGNCYTMASGISPPTEVKRVPQLQELVSLLRKAVNGMNDEYAKKMSEQNQYLTDSYQLQAAMASGQLDGFMFGSWSGFPLYDVEFGWGKPVWISPTALLHDRVNFLVDTKCGEGIEALVNMKFHDMDTFETQFNQL